MKVKIMEEERKREKEENARKVAIMEKRNREKDQEMSQIKESKRKLEKTLMSKIE